MSLKIDQKKQSYLDFSTISAYQQPNLNYLIRDCSASLESSKNISPLIQTLIEKIQICTFWERRVGKLRYFNTYSVLPLLFQLHFCHDSNSDVENKFHDFLKEIVCLKLNAAIDTLVENERGRAEDTQVSISRHVKTKAISSIPKSSGFEWTDEN